MLLEVHGAQGAPAAWRPPWSAFGARLAWLMAWPKRSGLQAALAAAAGFGVVAFVLGAGNRLTRGPWFLYPPEVSLVPPFGRAAWQQAFVLHQQSPLYALCGGYDGGGMASITIYQFLYWWEWSRIAAIVLFAAALFAASLFYLFGRAGMARRAALLPFAGLLAAVVGYFVLRYFADHAGLFAVINLGQHRHALDITCASVGLAVLIVAAMAPERAAMGSAAPRVAWATVIALDIGFGALFEALDAGPLWMTFPGYSGTLIPTPDRLFALHPLWRNLTENGYLVQTCHRLLSIGLWGAALLVAATALLRRQRCTGSLVLLALFTLEGALGIVALRPGQPVIPSILHQVCAVAVLAAALAPPERWPLWCWRGRKPGVGTP
jgi:heme A synthase